MEEDEDPVRVVGGEVGLHPLALLDRLRQGGVHDLGVEDDEVRVACGPAVERLAEVLVPPLEESRFYPSGGHSRIRLVSDVHVAGREVDLQARLLELGHRSLPSRVEEPGAGVLLGQISHVEDQLGLGRLGKSQRPVATLRPLPHDLRCHRVALGGVHARIHQVMSVGEHHELQVGLGYV